MSDLLRSAMQARVSKLPLVPPTVYPGAPAYDDEDEAIDEEAEAADSLGSLPSSMGPPRMQVYVHKSVIQNISYPIRALLLQSINYIDGQSDLL